ncbi:hypothetical protein J2W56_001073 [Nocardia kruczakiae]|uniref:Uncharacterized protein n=1 Tax=Nocardia kruczakiae TaxID=261477 RepID=A0ABU1X9X3_9NOCA|nr:hypothetical protein [Nocardia kruczakiae]
MAPITVDEFRQTWDTAAIDRDYEIAAYGLAKAGATAAAWWKVEAMMGDSPVLVYNKILRLHEDAAPDWPNSALANGKPSRSRRRLDLLTQHHQPTGPRSERTTRRARQVRRTPVRRRTWETST